MIITSATVLDNILLVPQVLMTELLVPQVWMTEFLVPQVWMTITSACGFDATCQDQAYISCSDDGIAWVSGLCGIIPWVRFDVKIC